MFFKTTLVFCISAVLAFHIQDTPEDLKTYFEQVDTQVKALEHETMIQIRTNVIPLSVYIQQAKTDLIQNITDSAKTYWATIKSLQESAEEKGQNISACIDLGNNLLYDLNRTIVDKAYQSYSYYNQSGTQIIYDSATEAYTVIEELIALHQVVVLCNDDTCATNLKKIVTQYYQRAKATLIDAETKPRNYVLVYLPELLAQHQVDSQLYVSNYTVILSNINGCINNL